MKHDYGKWRLINDVAMEFEWDKWREAIPFIQWPNDWKVKAIPPTHTGVIRYLVQTTKCDRVSIYLDCYDMVGFEGHPYWEVYPVDGDCERCSMSDTRKLLDIISRAGVEKEVDTEEAE
jgi:hypothetical protein